MRHASYFVVKQSLVIGDELVFGFRLDDILHCADEFTAEEKLKTDT